MSKITDEERELFRAAMTNVKPLKTVKRLYFSVLKKNPAVRRLPHPENEDLFFEPSDQLDPTITADQSLSFSRAGVNNSIFKKLQKGILPISAKLDLHGETKEAARALLTQFIQHCYQHRQRYVCIVHGKGRSAKNPHPILKNQIYHWLPQFPEVLAFQSAAPQDGGTGAVYVLLKSI